MTALRFNLERPEHYNTAKALSPLVRRIMAPNAGAFTFSGTATHILGTNRFAIIDPGSDDPHFLEAILRETHGGTITHILVTHTHSDHTAGVAALARETGAMVVGCAPHTNYPAGNFLAGETADAHVDYGFRPDRILEDSAMLHGGDWTVESVATPGHTANHLGFALREENALFSGDHVMGWSSTVIAPPVGDMRAYMHSLRKLLFRPEMLYYPAHGMPVMHPPDHVAALIAHREARHEQVMALVRKGSTGASEITALLYPDVPQALRPAALMTVQAHLDAVSGGNTVL